MIRGWGRELQQNPREDMPGAKPCREYTLWWSKRMESEAIERESRRALAAAEEEARDDQP